MNEYLKEIAIICNLAGELNTHKAGRTFGSTVTLKNGLSIIIMKKLDSIKEMLLGNNM